MKVYITDYIEIPNIEKKILNNFLCNHPNKSIEILLVWHQFCDQKYLSQFPKLKLIISIIIQSNLCSV